MLRGKPLKYCIYNFLGLARLHVSISITGFGMSCEISPPRSTAMMRTPAWNWSLVLVKDPGYGVSIRIPRFSQLSPDGDRRACACMREREIMDLLRLTGLAMLEGYGAQRVLPEYHLRTTFLASLLVNLLLTAFYYVAVYPFFVNPLRHLPTVKVCSAPGTGPHRHTHTHSLTRPLVYNNTDAMDSRAADSTLKSSSMTLEDVFLWVGSDPSPTMASSTSATR